ncbi:MAG: B12-binding domain-containing radical SAM protein [Thermodesulfobacterium geofontis]|uniref:B12-binding domain-containing radical SAM protein n=1 Tax=Thermodesulfobacterium geofontis TaxID=1295609 RepID=A0A2N7PLZ3_9BACT|nr:MAG: B12-binding domain-containing radical SAM protein [Thermodesulfobacterium geofontis]
MIKEYPDELLISLKKPSRYLGKEPFFPYKDWEKTRLKVCLGYPDLYEVGRSHLGINILAGIINENPDYLCDLVYAVSLDMEKELKKRRIPLLSYNYRKPLKEFDVVGLSYAYELLITGLFQILELSYIPLKSEERTLKDPIILGGGPCCGNPEPVAFLFDAIVIGDGEEVIFEILKVIEYWKKEKLDRKSLWDELKKIEGVYVPILKNSTKRRIFLLKRRELPILSSIPIIPLSHDRISLEISRGCTRSCRFCEAGFYYRPVREKTPEELVSEVKKAFELTGYREASLTSLSAGDYTLLETLIVLLEKEFYSSSQREYVFSLPSLRVGSLTPKILNFLKKGRISTITLAIEAASERLRRVINKKIEIEALYRDLECAQKYGFKRIKLYFMIGLPTEKEEDLKEIVKFYRELKKTFKDLDITISTSIFVPKPHTPFQWERQITVEEAMEKIRYLKSELRKNFKYHQPQQSFLEGVIARGERNLFSYLLEVYKKGARLDSWKEYFNFAFWEDTAFELGLELKEYLKERDVKEKLPWDHIDLGVKKEFLLKERKKAYKELYTEDCRWNPCVKCGICKGEIRNYLSSEEKWQNKISSLVLDNIKNSDKTYWYEIYYDKLGPSKFFSQLEILRLIELVLRRNKIPLSYTQGFNPRPKFVCGSALPVGVEAEGEFLGIGLKEKVPEEFLKGIKIYEGLIFKEVKFKGKNKPSIPEREEVYLIYPGPKKVVSPKRGISILKFLKEELKVENPLKEYRVIKVYK